MNKSRTTNIGTSYEKKRYEAARTHQELTLKANNLYDKAVEGKAHWSNVLEAAKEALYYIRANAKWHPNANHHIKFWCKMVDKAEARGK